MIPAALVLAGVAAAVAPAPIRFAPASGTPFMVETRETRTANGQLRHFTMRHRVRFVPLGAGWRLDATMVDYATDATGVAKAAYEAAMRPFVDVTTTVAVSAKGEPVGTLDADAAWAKVAAGQRAAADAIVAAGIPPARAAAVRAHFAAIANLTGAARDAMLTAFAEDLLALSAPALRPGERAPYEGTSNVPGAGTVRERGTTAYVGDEGGVARFTLDAEADPADLARAADALAANVAGADPAAHARLAAAAARVRTTRVVRHDTYLVDRATGLVRSSTTRLETSAGDEPASVVERTLTVTPAPVS